MNLKNLQRQEDLPLCSSAPDSSRNTSTGSLYPPRAHTWHGIFYRAVPAPEHKARWQVHGNTPLEVLPRVSFLRETLLQSGGIFQKDLCRKASSLHPHAFYQAVSLRLLIQSSRELCTFRADGQECRSSHRSPPAWGCRAS